MTNEEAVNTQKVKKADESMTTRAIKWFIEKKLSLGGDVFNQMMKSKCHGLEAEFATYIAQNRDFDSQSKEQQESFKAVTSAQFLRETIAIGAAFTSKRQALEHVISRNYDFSAPEMKKIRTKYESLSQQELTTYVQSEMKRDKFLKNIFPGKTLPYRSETEQINAVFGHNTLNAAQEEQVLKLLTARHVDPYDVQEALPLFKTEKQKQLLLKIFLPTVTLGALAYMGVLTHAQVKAAIYQSIEHGNLVPEFKSMSETEKKEAVDQIDPDDIVIETMLFPDDVVDTILAGQGSKSIAEELSRINTERYDAVEADNALKMTPTKEWLFLPPFLEKLDKLGIKNTADLKPGAIIRVTEANTSGVIIAEYAFRIDDISDEPQFNKNTGGNGRVFAISDVLLADGSLRLNTKKSKAAEYSYTEMYNIFDKSKANVEILSPENIEHRIASGTIKESLLDNDIQSLADLNRGLNSIDPKGSSYPLQADGGSAIQVWEPGDKDFDIYQIKSINEKKGTIEIVGTWTDEILDYISFYSAFGAKKAKRLPPMKTAHDFLSAMKSHSAKGSAYGDISLDGEKFIANDRKWEKDYPGVTRFIGSKGCVQILNTKTPGIVEFLVYEEYDEHKDMNKQKSKPYKYSGWYHLLYNFLNRESFTPDTTGKKTQAADQVDPHIHYHKGHVKHYMGNPSLQDILHGAKGVLDAIKHKLEHGSHLHAANVQLAIGKGMRAMGLIDPGFLREMRSWVHTKNKKLMQEMVDELKNMSGPDRQEEVMHILSSKGSHDYEIQAATMAMLQKHGALYVGKLKIWERSFIYFERISGLKYSKNLEVVQKYMKRCDKMGEPFTEEGLIIFYIKAEGEQDKLDGTLWTEIAKAWGMGIEEQEAAGKKEVGKFQTSKGRMQETMDKLEWGEKAKALGGFDAIWGKWWPAHEMHMPAIILALSNVPETLHQDQLNTMKNKFFGGHPYTALLFLWTAANQHIFRSVIKKLAVNNGMATDYAKIEALQKKDPDKKLIDTIRKFWEAHGATLNKKLNVTADGELLHLAKTDGDCAAYLETCKWSWAAVKKLDDDELGNESYDSGGSSFLGLNPDQYFKFIKMNAAQGIPMDDDTTKLFWSGFQKSLKGIKDMDAKTPEIKKEIQKDAYMSYHKAFLTHMNGSFKKSMYEEDLPKQNYIQELNRNYGIRLTIPSGKEFLETPEYRLRAEEDFESFLKWGREGEVKNEIEIVRGKTTDLFKGVKSKWAANDERMEQAA